jgi:hypothetical protein
VKRGEASDASQASKFVHGGRRWRTPDRMGWESVRGAKPPVGRRWRVLPPKP